MADTHFVFRNVHFRACNTRCAEAFKSDRQHLLIYGPYMRRSGGFYMSAEEWSRMESCCAYCNKPISK